MHVYSAACQAAPKQSCALLSCIFWSQKAHGTHPAFLKAAKGLRSAGVKGLKSDIASQWCNHKALLPKIAKREDVSAIIKHPC